MRIFVVGTGRCGTVTFSKAAAHATNYTVGHESHAGRIGDWRYPDNHIEVSAQLVFAIPLLKRRYPAAFFIHLQRTNRDACVQSLARMNHVMRAFSLVFFQQQNPNPITVAGAIYDTFNPLCAACCDYRLDLETIMHDWRDCWYHMGCEGDFDASLAEWDVRYNASEAVT